MKRDLSKVFGKFAGKELMDPNRLATVMDPVLMQLDQEAKKHGLSKVRVRFPGFMYTQDVRGDRLTVDAEKGSDGKYRLKNNFRIG